MRVERGKIPGGLRLDDALRFHGIVEGSVQVAAGGHLILHGTVAGDVIVEAGGVAEVRGMVTGNVTNQGGELEVSGTVMGQLHQVDGTTHVITNSMIGGVRQTGSAA